MMLPLDLTRVFGVFSFSRTVLAFSRPPPDLMGLLTRGLTPGDASARTKIILTEQSLRLHEPVTLCLGTTKGEQRTHELLSSFSVCYSSR